MQFKELYKSKIVHGTIIGILIAIGAVLIFRAGMEVGERKAQFVRGAGENYSHVFDNPFHQGFFGNFMHDDMMGGHGAAGKIVRIALPTIVIADRNNTEKSITIETGTAIREFTNTMTPDKLAINDFVVVLGTPNTQGVIDATLIRVLPPPAVDATTNQPKI